LEKEFNRHKREKKTLPTTITMEIYIVGVEQTNEIAPRTVIFPKPKKTIDITNCNMLA
jgi:hypothetical protein